MKQRLIRFGAMFVAINMLYEIAFPTVVYALTGGPSQPEVQSFEPVGTTEMVDLFSGDFNYNIPLLDVEGYPINISYHSGITMDQEASWVGLGWNINPGVINRNMRGVPDDFKGDAVQKDFYMKPNSTLGMNVGASFQLFGIQKPKLFASANVSMGIFYNNYKGVGFEQSAGMAISAGNRLKLGGNLSLSSNTQSGLTIARGLSFGVRTGATLEEGGSQSVGVNFSVGSSVNSRSGMKTLTFSKGLDFQKAGSKYNLDFDEKGDIVVKGSGIDVSISNGGSAIVAGCNTYVPQITMPMNNLSISLGVTFGAEIFGGHPNISINGYYSGQNLSTTSSNKGAVGYMYTHERGSNNVLLDVNREKDGAFSKNSPVLPITNYTYDMYAVSGQGIGGMYRPHRGDIGVLCDDEMRTTSGSVNLGAEFGVGNLVHNGFNVNVNYAYSQSGMWTDGNGIANTFESIQPSTVSDRRYEPVYFKNQGEKTPVETGFLPNVMISEAFRADLNIKGKSVTSPSDHVVTTGVNSAGGDVLWVDKNQIYRHERDKRNQSISYLTAKDSAYCMHSYMQDYALNTPYYTTPTPISRLSDNRKDHHISEIVAINAGGSRYVYGIAAYNAVQKEIAFTNNGAANVSTGLAKYDYNIVDQKQGPDDGAYDGYYSNTTLPAYAHSYLLTSVLSPDYVDVNQNGVDSLDLGSYTKINYSRAHTNYGWRTPYGKDSAMYNQGLLTDPYDNKASIIYGEKEMWYVHSIESRNYVAEFTLEAREDGLGVDNTDTRGEKNTARRMYRLVSIALYTKAERRSKGSNAVPIKTVHFEYDYSLCKGIRNSTSSDYGKLTLKKIYFTYGNSYKSKFSAYEFNYSKHNFSYNIKGYDRWGNYKTDNATRPNSEYPYVEQDTSANRFAQAWSLDDIGLPSGGHIKVEYEADDYAYVQNKRAMQMFKIQGFGFDSTGTSVNNELYNADADKYYIFINLDYAVETKEEFKREYLSGVTNLFFNALVDMTTSNKKEFVRGYAQVVDGGITNDNRGWILVSPVDNGHDDRNVNPICRAAWQVGRTSTPNLIYPGSDLNRSPGDAPLAVAKMLVGVFVDLAESIEGLNNKLRRKGYGKTVDLNRSYIRLNNAAKKKYGGGARVKQLQLTDNWSAMGRTGEADFGYGQEYDYTIQEKIGNTSRTISSGVASYEPIIGNEENPWRQPVSYDTESYLIPDITAYVETPFGESFFPSASVGYSRVTVRNITREHVNRHATGKVLNEFYTAYDFPTITKQKEVDTRSVEPSIINSLFAFKQEYNMTASTGYLIELNDMHGKPKAVWNYEQGNPDDPDAAEKIKSGVQYFYKTDANNPQHLNNDISVISKDGSIATKTVGVEVDLVADMREQFSESYSGGVQVNFETFIIPFFIPLVLSVPVVLPSYSSEKSTFRTSVITKVVNRFGILDHTVAYQEGATITTANLAVDGETGEVLLTRTQNEFKDDLYNLTYPAHWPYDRMGPAYRNVGVTLTDVTYYPENGGIILTSGSVADYFADGDEVILTGTSIHDVEYNDKFWVVFPDGSASAGLVDQTGASPDTGEEYTIRIIRSGRKNMQSIPVMQITSGKKPVNSGGTALQVDSTKNILNASASVFSEVWRTNCNFSPTVISVCDSANGNYQLVKIASYLLSSGQINIGQTITTSGPNTVDTIDLSYSGHEVYDNSKIAEKIYNQCGITNGRFARRVTLTSDSVRIIYLIFSGAENCSPYFCYNMELRYKDTGCRAGNLPDSIVPSNVFPDRYHMTSRLYFPGGCVLDVPVYFECFDTLQCHEGLSCASAAPNIPNDYLAGTKGQWRKKKDYLYLDNRLATAAKPLVRADGNYRTFDPYWNYSGGSWHPNTTNRKWTWTSEVVDYDPVNGQELENKDPLGRHNAVLFTPTNTMLAAAVANNARKRDIAFEGFEDYNYNFTIATPTFATICPSAHWNFQQTTNKYIDTLIYHSGRQSLRLKSGQVVANEYRIFNNTSDTVVCEECIYPFTPDASQYVVSGWVRTSAVTTDGSDRTGYVVITYEGHFQKDTIRPAGSIIEGWQRIEGTVTIPKAAIRIRTRLVADALSADTAWFDDIRIHPFNATMKTFVYDPLNFRLSAELDENNYATFYEYDEQGALKRVKKETERGVATIRESRNNTIKKY